MTGPTLTIFVDDEDVTALIRKFDMTYGPDPYEPEGTPRVTKAMFDPPVRSENIQIFAEWDGKVYEVYRRHE